MARVLMIENRTKSRENCARAVEDKVILHQRLKSGLSPVMALPLALIMVFLRAVAFTVAVQTKHHPEENEPATHNKKKAERGLIKISVRTSCSMGTA